MQIYIFLIYVTNCGVFLPNLYYQQRLSLMGNASDFFLFITVDIQQPPFPSKYTKPTLPTLTHTRPRFLHRVVSMSRRRLGSPPVGCGPSCGSGTLTVGLVSEMNGHLLVGPRLLRGRFVFVNNIIVVSLVAIERH